MRAFFAALALAGVLAAGCMPTDAQSADGRYRLAQMSRDVTAAVRQQRQRSRAQDERLRAECKR